MFYVLRLLATRRLQMRIKRSSSWLVFCLLIAATGDGNADEPARAFLAGLRARGYQDVALDYLEQMETSRLAPAELKAVLPYERALILVEVSRAQRDINDRFAYLDQAQQLLAKFIATQGSHPKAHAARSQLGNLVVERARIKVEQAKSSGASGLLAEARKLYDQAFEQFSKLQAAIAGQLDQIPKVLDTTDRQQSQLAQRRTQLRADSLQIELLLAAIREEMADTFSNDSKQKRELLAEAADLYDGIYKKYRSRLAGLYARMYQGRCNHRLGKTKDALGYYGELLDQPNQPKELRTLKTKTLRLAMESWLAPQEQKYVEAIKRGSEWLLTVPREDLRQPDLLAIRFSLARAYKMQADELERRKPRNAQAIAVSIETGLQHAQFVASEPGELKEDAEALVVSLGGRRRAEEPSEPQSFAKAAELGKRFLDAVGPATQQVATVQSQLIKAKGSARESLLGELEQANADVESARQSAFQMYRLAMQFADRDTPPSELNLVRYFVCYLYYLNRQYYEAALVGDFVSQRFPESAGARQCAKISVASYLAILDAASEPTTAEPGVRFEIDRLMKTARLLATRWPESSETTETLATLVPVMVNAGAVREAAELTRNIPETALQRGPAELVAGQALWAAHLEAMRPGEDPDQVSRVTQTDDSPPNTAAALADEAIELLSAGFGRLTDSPTVNAYNATALLSLAQAYVKASEFVKAVEVLEHDQLGPMTLVDEKHQAAKNPLFVEETYRTALQAYVGSMDHDRQQVMPKAKQAMVGLRTAIGDDPIGQQRMLSVYGNLAKSVERQMESASPEGKQQLSAVFEAFLQELGSGSSEVGVLHWVAETFASLGAGFDDDQRTVQADARRYYERSIEAFENLLQLPTLGDGLATQVRARLAGVKADNRDFSSALSELETILEAKPNAINLQVQAARTLQRWAESDPTKYDEAIAGTGGPEGVIWGWGKIASATMQHKAFRDTFYQARYETVRCLFQQALSETGDRRNSLMSSAAQSVKRTMQLYPTLGGGEWTQKYEELLDDIRVAQGSAQQ